MPAVAILKVGLLGFGLAGLLATANMAVATDQSRVSVPEIETGKALFTSNCALCHSAVAGDGGGIGPRLFGLFDRPAATSDERFPYTAALRASNLTWDAYTLDKFLASPSEMVPGTAMVIEVPDPADRAALIAYFRALKKSAPVQ